MNIIIDNNKEQLYSMLAFLNEPKFRVDQLLNAIFNGKDYEDSLNLPKAMLEKLKELDYVMQPVTIKKAISSKGKHKTIKFLYTLKDGNIVEGVLMRYAFGNTLCVSTQVGCKMNCQFCASGLGGFVRNLSAGEILGQIIAVNKYIGGTLKDREITNVVLMGSGEPLDNFENLKKFLQLVTSEDCFNISVRNISVSTCGIPSKIEELADLGYSVTMCLSLHASNDVTRQQIMPIARRYSIKEIIESLKYYHTMTNRRIIIEYTLISGVNNTINNAKELSELLDKLPCHVNVIKLNEVDGRDLKSTTAEECKRFVDYLNRFGVSATLRRTLGDDIDGACGQLRNKELKEDDNMVENESNNETQSLRNKIWSDYKDKTPKEEKATITKTFENKKNTPKTTKESKKDDETKSFETKSERKTREDRPRRDDRPKRFGDDKPKRSFSRDEQPRRDREREDRPRRDGDDKKSFSREDRPRREDKPKRFGEEKPRERKFSRGDKPRRTR